MQEPVIEKQVQLAQDLPELGLLQGEIGMVCDAWSAPTTPYAYEVEFQARGLEYKTRTLLLPHQIRVKVL